MKPLFSPRFSGLLHGADYNPDQWLHMPEIIDEDFRMMKRAGCNVMSVGIFAWAALEPEEGTFRFEWLDRIMDRLADMGGFACLATPSGSRPRWLCVKYPETNRVGANRVANLPGERHNHNYSSAVMKEKVTIINTKLAERYAGHPALLLWHVSNEYGGGDHSEASQDAFRAWLRCRYHDDLDELNHAWWTGFWGHTFQDWAQIESPAPHGENSIHALTLDWKRFVTYQTVEFMKVEAAPLRRLTPKVPITTNMMGMYPGLDYFKFRDVVDISCWDNYPRWHLPGTNADVDTAALTALNHDLIRGMKPGQPFLLMESTPSVTNWQPVAKLKRPGMHLLSSLQAVAHGADSVMYFQWRKARGCSEKFHGAVVDHVGHENTRVFRDVAEVGAALKSLATVAGSSVESRVALLFDWDNRWAIEDSQGPRRDGRKAYEETVVRHYHAFWKAGVSVNVRDGDGDFAGYTLVIAPMLYLLKPGFAERAERFVSGGGTLVTTYWSGIVDEHDLCFLGGSPLRKLLGMWYEETDCLHVGEKNGVVFKPGNSLGLLGTYDAFEFFDLVHPEGAEVLATYASDFYSGMPAVTCNRFGTGAAYNLAARTGSDMLEAFYGELVKRLEIPRALEARLPEGVAATRRVGNGEAFVFVQNYTPEAKTVDLAGSAFHEMLSKQQVSGRLSLGPFGIAVLRSASAR